MDAIVALVLCLQEAEAPRPEPPKPQEKEVVVIGQRRESDVLDVPSAVTVVTGEQIEKSGATSVAEVVRRQPGFFAQGPNKGGYDQIIDLRGFNNGAGNGQRTLVLVDGHKTNGVATTATDWASIPLENIERIEIVRGPAAALYGDGALAGVVNIITKKGGKEAFSNVAASAGNWATYRASAALGGASGDLLFDLYAGLEGTEGFRDNSEYKGHNLTARLEAPLAGSLRGYLKAGGHADRRERPGTLSKAEIETLGRKASTTPGDGAAFEEIYLDAGLTQSLGDFGEASLFFNHTAGRGSQFVAAWGGFQIEDESGISMLQLKHVATPRPFGAEAVLTTGLDLSYETADSDSWPVGFDATESEYRRRLMGVYEHLEVRPLDFLVLTAGLRYDRALLNLDRDVPPGGWGDTLDRQRAFDQLSPHAGINFKVLEEASLYASWGRTFKYPTRDELIGFTAVNPDLDPERSHVYEAGARFWSGRWGSASVSVYRMVVADELFFDATTYQNFNFDEVTHQGVESEARVTPWDWLELFGTHALTRAVITEGDTLEGKHYPVTPRLSGTAGVVLRQWGASLTLQGRYVGRRYLINDVDNVEQKLSSYGVFDLKAAYAYKGLTAFVSVFNVADREYFDSGGITAGGPEFYPAAERSWLAGGEVRF